MKSKHSEEKQPHMTRGSVLDDFGFKPAEVFELKIKGEIYEELVDYIEERGYTQKELCKLLGVLQPEVSNLLNGRISKFSINKLIRFAGKLDLGAHVRLIRPTSRVHSTTIATISTEPKLVR